MGVYSSNLWSTTDANGQPNPVFSIEIRTNKSTDRASQLTNDLSGLLSTVQTGAESYVSSSTDVGPRANRRAGAVRREPIVFRPTLHAMAPEIKRKLDKVRKQQVGDEHSTTTPDDEQDNTTLHTRLGLSDDGPFDQREPCAPTNVCESHDRSAFDKLFYAGFDPTENNDPADTNNAWLTASDVIQELDTVVSLVVDQTREPTAPTPMSRKFKSRKRGRPFAAAKGREITKKADDPYMITEIHYGHQSQENLMEEPLADEIAVSAPPVTIECDPYEFHSDTTSEHVPDTTASQILCKPEVKDRDMLLRRCSVRLESISRRSEALDHSWEPGLSDADESDVDDADYDDENYRRVLRRKPRVSYCEEPDEGNESPPARSSSLYTARQGKPLEHYARLPTEVVQAEMFPYKCTICNAHFTAFFDWKKHVKIHALEKTTSDIGDLEADITEDHSQDIRPNGGKSHVKKPCTESSQLTSESDANIREEPYSCRVCRMVFLSSFDLTMHSCTLSAEHRSVDGALVYDEHVDDLLAVQSIRILKTVHICVQCQRNFDTPSGLKTHMRVHVAPEKSLAFSCGQCNEFFKCPSSLNSHKRHHPDQKQLVCGMCTATFDQLSNLRVHEQYQHTGEGSFVCHLCKSCFSSSYRRKLHMTSHTGDRRLKPFSCGNCFVNFQTASGLQIHERCASHQRNVLYVDVADQTDEGVKGDERF